MHPPKEAALKNIGGMQRVSLQLTDQLTANKGVQLIEFTRETRWKFIVVKTTFFLIRLFLFLPSFVKQHKPDVILFSSMVTGSLAYFTRSRIKTPMVSISHGHDVTLDVGIYQWLIKKVFRSLDGVISVSSATRQECLNRGLAEEKSKVLPNGFDVRDLKTIYKRAEAKVFLEQEFDFKLGNRKLLLTVGRLIKRKGHAWFIREVLPLINSDVVYLIIGDGPENASIRKAIRKSGMEEKVMFVGRQPDEVLDRAYSAADLFIMPNIKVKGDMEGFGVVLLEANVRNTPAIATDIEGIRDVITQGKNGYRIEEGDSGGFAQKVDEVITNELESLSESSRSFVEHQFSWEKVSKDYIKHLAGFMSANSQQ